MKNFPILALLACLGWLPSPAFSQNVPQAFTYQAVARDKSQKPIAGAKLKLDIAILQNGSPVYSEKVERITLSTGLFTVNVGEENPSDFQKIDWSAGNFEMEVSVSGAVNLTSRSPILSVPFALFSEKSAASTSLELPGATDGQVLKWNATAQKWLPAKDETGSGTGGATALEDLTDVNLAGLAAGKILKWDGAAWVPGDDATGSGGTATSVAAGTGIAVSQSGNTFTVSNTAPAVPVSLAGGGATVVSGAYPNFTVTSPASLPPGGAAGGDLSGNYPNPTVAKIQNRAVANTVPTIGQVLKWDGSQWTPQNDIGGGNGDNWGSQTTKTDATISGDGTAANPLKIAAQNAANNQFLKWNGTTWLPADVTISISNNSINSSQIVDNSITVNDLAPGTIPTTLPPSGAAGGDLSGNYPNPGVAKIQGRDVASTAPANNQFLKWNGTTWLPADVTFSIGNNTINSTQIVDNSITINDLAAGVIPTTLPPSGAAAGDLSGNYPNPGVAKIQGRDVANTAPANNQFLKWNGTAWLPADVTVSISNNSINSSQIIDNSVTVNDLAPGTIPTTLPPSGAAAGDLSGNYPNPGVAKIQGREVSTAAPSDGQVLKWDDVLKKWEPSTMAGGAAGWNLTGNGGTNPSTNFIGTTDGQPIVFKINGTEKMRLDAKGQLQIFGEQPANTFVGNLAGNSNTTGFANSFFGTFAGIKNTSGSDNNFFGYSSGFKNTSGGGNSFFGDASGYSNTSGAGNSFFGSNSGANNEMGDVNSFFGYRAGASNTTGAGNCFIGKASGASNLTANANTFMGIESGFANTIGSENNFLGKQAGFSNISGNSNVAVGNSALFSNTTSSNQVAVGDSALYSNTGGIQNTAIGSKALFSNTNGIRNTANGYEALFSNTIGNWNTANGFQALYTNTTGIQNTAIGFEALVNNTTGKENTATGEGALRENTVGNSNTAFGKRSLLFNKIGNYNTAIGMTALVSNIDGSFNTAIGSDALRANSSGSMNTVVGAAAMNNNSTGNENTALGRGALQQNETGIGNTAIGSQAFANNISGQYNTALGYLARSNISNLSNQIVIGSQATTGASNSVSLGNTSITSIKGQVGFTTYSDQKIKTQIQENIPGLAFIQKLRPVTYRYDIHRQNALLGIRDTAMWEGKYDIEKMTFSGFLAQEVEQAARAVGYDFSGVDAPKNEQSLYGLRYAEFVVPLVKAVQEQQETIETQRQQLENQGKILAGLQARLEALEAAGKVKNE